MPMPPSCHGWAASHSIVASPSSRSSKGSNEPPEPNVPRTLCTTAWSPRSASRRPNSRPTGPRRPYGERTSTVGDGASGLGA